MHRAGGGHRFLQPGLEQGSKDTAQAVATAAVD